MTNSVQRMLRSLNALKGIPKPSGDPFRPGQELWCDGRFDFYKYFEDRLWWDTRYKGQSELLQDLFKSLTPYFGLYYHLSLIELSLRDLSLFKEVSSIVKNQKSIWASAIEGESRNELFNLWSALENVNLNEILTFDAEHDS